MKISNNKKRRGGDRSGNVLPWSSRRLRPQKNLCSCEERGAGDIEHQEDLFREDQPEDRRERDGGLGRREYGGGVGRAKSGLTNIQQKAVLDQPCQELILLLFCRELDFS